MTKRERELAERYKERLTRMRDHALVQHNEVDVSERIDALDYALKLVDAELSDTPDRDTLRKLLRYSYSRIPQDRLGRSRCIDPDPAGGTYEFTEHEWSVQVRAVLGIQYEPTGI